jgi:hypothetical protein
LTVSTTGKAADEVVISRFTADIVFPTDEYLPELHQTQSQEERNAVATGGLNGASSIPRMMVGKIYDLAMNLKGTWAEGPEIRKLIEVVYKNVKFNRL